MFICPFNSNCCPDVGGCGGRDIKIIMQELVLGIRAIHVIYRLCLEKNKGKADK